jgi:hypothetical protein
MYLAEYVDDPGMISLRYDCLLLVYVMNFYVSGWIVQYFTVKRCLHVIEL